MNINFSLLWMFIGSLIIGIFFNGMNILAYRYNDLYFSSKTLVYSALLMASNMCILEIFMHYSMKKHFYIYYFLFFILLTIILIFFLRKQIFINDKDWLKRMISHHSTAITTSKKISQKTNNKEIKNLAESIILNQEKEIIFMKKLLNNKI